MLWALTLPVAEGLAHVASESTLTQRMDVGVEWGMIGVRFAMHVGEPRHQIVGLVTLQAVLPVRGTSDQWTWVFTWPVDFTEGQRAIDCIDRRVAPAPGLWMLPATVSKAVAMALPAQRLPYIRRNDNSPEALRLRMEGAAFPKTLGRWWRTP